MNIPQMIFEKLDREFHFTLDAAADASNAKVPLFFSKGYSALNHDWSNHTAWLNPPGDQDPETWALKAMDAAEKGATVVMVARPRVNKHWFHECLRQGEVRFIECLEDDAFYCIECGQLIEFCIVIFRPRKGEKDGNAATP